MADALRMMIGMPFDHESPGALAATLALNEATDACEWILQPPGGLTITQIGFLYGSRTGTPPTYKASIQGVTAGVPDGTIKGGGSPASVTFTPPADTSWNALWQWVTLDNAWVSDGSTIAIVIQYDSGTVSASHFSSFRVRRFGGSDPSFPYAIQNSAGSRTRFAQPVYAYRTASKIYGYPFLAAVATSFSVNSTPDEYALHFSIPASLVSTYKVRGIRGRFGLGNAGKTMVVNLYDTNGTGILQTLTWDADDQSSTATGNGLATLLFPDTLAVLSGDGVYRIGFAPQDTSQNAQLQTISVTDADHLAPFPFGGLWHLDTRTDGGAWTAVTGQRPIIELILEEWAAP